ncbi:acid protease [Pilatotrama ljubarskyi]|nr:acid protease [Pilatotrama ljubarskyi]
MLAHLLPIVALAVCAVVAKPIVIRDSPVTLPIARRFNVTAAPNLLELDQARAKVLKEQGLARGKDAKLSKAGILDSNFPVTNGAVDYTASVGVGTPPTTYNLIVDTGSSNTWVGAGTEYVPTNSSVDTGDEVIVEYGSGIFFGEEYTDTVTIGDLTIKAQSIGVAEFAIGFDGVDGILGLGPDDLTEGTTSSGAVVPTVVDNAFAQGLIDSKVVGISFEPTTSLSVTNGELTFGGTDSSKYTGEIAYVPVTSTAPASSYVGIDQSITYGSAGTTILSSTAGITDTGTTLVLIASDALSAYQAATGAVADSATGLLKITAEQFANLESLFFHIGDNTYEFTANAQIWPRALNTAIGGDADSVYLIVADLGSDSGEGLDFIDGFTFLERFYNVWDSANSQVGFATTPFTDATTN